MLDTLEIFEQLREDFPETVARKLATLMGRIYTELANTVTKTEFNELREVVGELAEAQKRTEQKVEELAEAQKRTEQKVEELAEAQKKTEQKVEELAEAQKKTEQKVEELAEAQRRTEARVEELAEAQKRTEAEIQKLSVSLRETRQMVGGLSDTVGYGLEDRIFPFLEEFARREFGIEVDLLDRRNIVYPDGRFDQANIYVEGRRKGRKVYLIGECKARPSKKEIKRFSDALRRMRAHLGAEVQGFLVGSYYSPQVERYIIKEEFPDIRFMKSFEFELRYSGKKTK